MNERECVVVSCDRPATMRLTMGTRIAYYCDYHTGECGGLFIDAAWPFLQQASETWEQEQERQRHESEDA